MRPTMGITNHDILEAQSFERGQFDNDIKSPRTLTPEAQRELEKVTKVSKDKPHRPGDGIPNYHKSKDKGC